MQLKGINYDVGTFTTPGSSSRESFDPAIVRRETAIIRDDLHCNAMRISGQDPERLRYAAECALQAGMEAWISPALVNATPQATLEYLHECAQMAEELRLQWPQVVLVAGTELTFFMKGLVLGETPLERMNAFVKPWRLIASAFRIGSFDRNLNGFLARAAGSVRRVFHGRLSYASGVWESVDWSPFDLVGVDYYMDAMTKRNYREKLRAYQAKGKPVVITEFGCCTYRGAEEKGGYGWAIVDRSQRPPCLKGEYVRSEETQAKLIEDSLEIFEAEKAHGAFVFTFVMPKYPYHEDHHLDLDMASFGIVKSYADHSGSAYPGLSWDPKQAFGAVAARYGRMGERA